MKWQANSTKSRKVSGVNENEKNLNHFYLTFQSLFFQLRNRRFNLHRILEEMGGKMSGGKKGFQKKKKKEKLHRPDHIFNT